MASHNQLGKSGEELAAAWLKQNGFELMHQNWRYSHYEIDLVAKKNNVLHFIEVKTRQGQRFGRPEESVSKKKIQNLMQAGAAFQERFPGWKRVQYNILSINLYTNKEPEYYLIEDVYYWK